MSGSGETLVSKFWPSVLKKSTKFVSIVARFLAVKPLVWPKQDGFASQLSVDQHAHCNRSGAEKDAFQLY